MDMDTVDPYIINLDVQPRDREESADAGSEDIFNTHFFESESVEGVFIICDLDSEGPAHASGTLAPQRLAEPFAVAEDL
eukprot:3161242-Amphidinium_carterae.1